MGVNVGWFVSLSAAAVLAFALGHLVGRRSGRMAWLGLTLGMMLLLGWVTLLKHPAVAVHILPLHLLAYLEGTGAVPAFTFIIGIVLARSALPRQKRLASLALCLAVLYFLNGSLWLLQSTPQVGFAEATDRRIVLQSQEFSCVAAASATALNLLDLPTSESQMAQLAQVRPGTGATLLRAMQGLQRRLDGTGHHVELLQPTLTELASLPTPMITPVAYERTRQHMVVLLSVTDRAVLIADPALGVLNLSPSHFARYYTGRVLVFRR